MHNTTQHNTTHVNYLRQRLFVKQFAQSLLSFKELVDSFCVSASLKGGVEFA